MSTDGKIHGDKLRVKTREEFFDLLREKYPRTTGPPLGDYRSIRKEVKAVFHTLRNYINEGGLRHLQVQLPQPIADLWETEPFERKLTRLNDETGYCLWAVISYSRSLIIIP